MLLDGPVLEVADDEDEPTPALRVAALAPSGSNLGPLLHVARGALSGDHDAESWNNKLCSMTEVWQHCGCGAVGRAVASDSRDPWFEPQHRQ